MIYCDNPKFVYVAPPKTGTTSIVAALKQLYPTCVDWGDNKHLVCPARTLLDHFWFISLRNPFSRIVSWWDQIRLKPVGAIGSWRRSHYERFKDSTFKQWLNHVCEDWTPGFMYSYYYCLGVMPRLDAVVRFENIVDDFAALPFVPNDFKLPKLRASPRKQPWQSYYTADDARRVAVSQIDEFLVAGYSPDPSAESARLPRGDAAASGYLHSRYEVRPFKAHKGATT